jgi:mono/diheme cytochrome c family protein
VVVATLVAGCAQENLSPEAERGRQIYQSQCIACHNPDPSQAGAIGPDLKGSPEQVLRAKVVSGAYPPGYKPKRPTGIMQPMPQLAADVPNLAAYLR